MDALVVQSRSLGPVTLSCNRAGCDSEAWGASRKIMLRRSYVSTGLTASFPASCKAKRERQLRQLKQSVAGRRNIVQAKLAAEEEVEDVPTEGRAVDNVAESIALLKTAAKTRKVSSSEICRAFRTLEKAKVDPSAFPSAIGGTQSPGRSWMLIFSGGKDELKKPEGGGFYFPVTAVQKFDAQASQIENGVFLGRFGSFTLTGKYTFEKRKLTFNFHTINLTLGSLKPFSFGIGNKEKEVTKDDPYFIWFYADDEIVVARGRSGGTAFWVRCTNVKKSLP